MEQNACLLHENGSDQSVHSCPSPTDGGGDDMENLAASSLLQAWFDMEVFEVHESDDLDVVAATEQHWKKRRSDQMFRSSRQKRSQTAPSPSRVFLAQKVESDFAARNVTELIVDDGRQAGRQRSEDAVERCRWIDSVCEISRKDREAAKKQTWFRRAVEPERRV